MDDTEVVKEANRNKEICVFCGMDESPWKESKFVCLTKKGCETINNLYVHLQKNIEVTIGQTVHEKCRLHFHKEKKKQSTATEAAALDNPEPEDSFDGFNICLFCGCPAKSSHKSKKGTDVYAVKTEQFQKTMETLIIQRKDQWADEVKKRIGTKNLSSSGAMYHQKCNLKFRQISSNVSVGRPQDENRQIAFLKVADYMKEHEEDAFTLNDLVEVMKRECIGDVQEYCGKFLKQKLIEHFGDKLYFLQREGKPDYVIFRHTANLIISESYENKKTGTEAKKMKVLESAAQIIRSDIKSINYNKEAYPTADQISRIGFHLDFVPDSLLTLLNGIIKVKDPDLIIASIAQSIIQAAIPRLTIAPLQIGLGVYLHHLTDSKFVVKILHRLGFCCSYDEVLRFRLCAAATKDDESILDQPSSSKQVIKYAADNIDHDTRTIDGKNTFHGMGMISMHTPQTSRNRIIKRIKPTIEDVRAIGSVPILQYTGESKEKNIFYGDISSLSGIHKMKKVDLLLNVTWRCDIERPSWSGLMQSVNRGDHPGKSSVQILPMIDLNPSDMNCVYSTLHFLTNEAEKHKVSPIVAFDQPLNWKAHIVIENEPQESSLKNIVLLLGGFHTQMSFLGTIGHLCEGLGLEETLETIYATNSVPHILSGKAYSRAVRAHFLVDLVLNKLFMEEIVPQKMTKLEWEQALSKANSLFDDLLAQKITVSELESSKLLLSIQEEISAYKNILISKSRTAKLWLQYMEMVDILKSFIRSERTGDWQFNLMSFRTMLPYMAAAGHNAYTKCGYIYLQQMIQLEKTHPDVYADFSGGHYIVRRSDRYYAGLSCDLTIEQVLMRSIKSQTGCTRGRGIGENQRLIWVNSMHECVSIKNAMQDLTGLHYETSEQHKDVGASRQKRDLQDLRILLEFLKERNPFKTDEGPALRNIFNGMEAHQAVNADEAREIGEKIISSMKDENVADYTFKNVNKAVTMHTRNTILIDGEIATIDPQLLFQRLILLVRNMDDAELRDVFKYELSHRPSALFDDHGFMRSADNTSLDNALMKKVGLENPVKIIEGVYILSGNFLINSVAWVKNQTYDDICSKYVAYIQQYNKPIIVLEDYSSEPSIRDEFRARKNKGATGVNIAFTGNMLFNSKKEAFLVNKFNQQRFTDMLSKKLAENGCTVIKASTDINLIITRTVIKSAAMNETTVISDDSELLYVLCSHFKTGLKTIVLKHDGKGIKTQFWNIGKIQSVIGGQMMYFLPFVKAVGGCKTTSHSFGVGNAIPLNKLLKDEEFQNVAMVFCNPKSTITEITYAGNKGLVMLYNGKKRQTLNALRYERFADKVLTSKTCINVETLPPTEAAAHYHSLRVFLQTQIWLGNESLNALDYGWKKVGEKLLPKTTDLEVAPKELLSKIRCGCKGNCSTRKCNCQRNGMKCTVACTVCRGCYCLNPSEIVHDDELEENS